MRKFRVFQHPSRGYEAVKVGFSWPCFFFGIIWALVKRLWLFAAVAGGVVVVMTILELAITSGMNEESALFVSLALNLMFMVGWIAVSTHANRFRESKLYDHGYRLVGEVHAEHPEDAIGLSAQPETSATGITASVGSGA